jgi:aryl-alcohol dehydrogenase (NADP+)
MQHVPFGRSGLRVSRLCLGTMTFGLQCDDATSHAILDAASEGGIDFLDTADVYPLGGGQRTRRPHRGDRRRLAQGQAPRLRRRHQVRRRHGPKPWDQGMSRKHVLDAIDASLKRLGTDYIDLYQLHSHDPNTPLDEALEALEAASSAPARPAMSASPTGLAHRVARAVGRTELKNLAASPPSSRATTCSSALRARPPARSARRRASPSSPTNPLAGGLLTGKHDGAAPPPQGSRFALGNAGPRYQERYWHDGQFAAVERPPRRRRTRPACQWPPSPWRWVLSHPAITAPIIGASRAGQLKDSLAAAEAGPPARPEIPPRRPHPRLARAVDADR